MIGPMGFCDEYDFKTSKADVLFQNSSVRAAVVGPSSPDPDHKPIELAICSYRPSDGTYHLEE